ncbi:glycosyltransferase family 2 protein [Elizabethkingia meningoseptica]|uniref:glycosyltransferase family 2 protein n=1 Tax=Elizabethkingia meningoseptica TaxID=238 RepID=UPI0038912C63
MITVIIPSYNRAHLLSRTIPSYIQDNVSRILLIDDASTDNTAEVAEKLKKSIQNLEYYRLENNSKQVFAKNFGLDMVTTEWVYFGDDDSILIPGSIEELLKTCLQHNADICGGKALYQDKEEDIDLFVEKNKIFVTLQKIVNIKNLTTNFQYSVSEPGEVPFTHASALVKANLAKKIKFDTKYFGNCYREETDFFIRCKLAGAKIFYNSNAAQVNLPRVMATGGAHSSSKVKWYYYSIVNNHYFMKKNWKSIRKHFRNVKPSFIVELMFIVQLFSAAIRNIGKRLMKI